jgi:hypothetical protein
VAKARKEVLSQEEIDQFHRELPVRDAPTRVLLAEAVQRLERLHAQVPTLTGPQKEALTDLLAQAVRMQEDWALVAEWARRVVEAQRARSQPEEPPADPAS